MRSDVAEWFDSATSVAADWPADELVKLKGDTTVSVILPALNEEQTVGAIVRSIRESLMAPCEYELVDELIVLDSGSTDATAREAEDAGATVLHRDDILPSIPPVSGKGEAMWRATATSTGDIVVFIDADLKSFTPTYVTALIGPLLSNPTVQLVKAVYERPLVTGDTVVQAGGGRVTELMARPLLNLYWPELAGIIQPLAGEYAARRSLLEQLPFPCGYGVEIAILIDTMNLYGLHAIAQVDLGVRVHRHQDERRLGRMAAQILRTATARLASGGRVEVRHDLGEELNQFARDDDRFTGQSFPINSMERPPLISIDEYNAMRTTSIES